MQRFIELWGALQVCAERPVYLLLDCAGFERGFSAIPQDLFDRLQSLVTGDLGDELADTAGYLGRIVKADAATAARVEELLDAQLAMLLVPRLAPAEPGEPGAAPDFAVLHRHLRKYNVVYSADGKPLFFRYYDPRVVDDLQRAGLTELTGPVFAPFEALVYRDAMGQWARVSMAAAAEA